MADRYFKAVSMIALTSVAAVGLFAQPTIKVTTKSGSSTVTTVTSPAPKKPLVGKNWDGINSTDYYRFAPPNQIAPPNPDIAVGPEDILTVVDRGIAHYNNPNSPENSVVATNIQPRSFVLLDVWLGKLMDTLCPTSPRTALSCVISNGTVRYDQLQGRFVVAMTVVDTGFVQNLPAQARKASWVLVVSRFGYLVPAQVDGQSTVFTSPNPPASIGGIFDGNWLAYTGDINDVENTTLAQGVTGVDLDCSAGAIAPTQCYMPTAVRIGIDNNNVILASPVIDDNVAQGSRAATPAYRGTRVRVFKKSKIYPYKVPVTQPSRGTMHVAADASNTNAGFFDVFPLDTIAVSWTVDPNQEGVIGLFYEPVHLRGRAIASFSATMVGANKCVAPFDINPSKCEDSQTYLLGAQSSHANADTAQTRLFWRSLSFDPATGIPALGARTTTSAVLPFKDPACVAQGPNTDVEKPPCLYVGDDRPQRVMFREGLLYSARVGDLSPGEMKFDGTPLSSTVIYDVFRKVSQAGAADQVLTAQWQNGNYWAPMYDTPANVVQAGSVSPVNLLPFLEKLFVATSYKALFPMDQPAVSGGPLTFPSLFDVKAGLAPYDTVQTFIDPYTGATIVTHPLDATKKMVPFGIRGGAATDPNNGSLWNYGAYARLRLSSVVGPGQWGTYVSNYDLSFPSPDPYGNETNYFDDVKPGSDAGTGIARLFDYVQIARQVGLAQAKAGTNMFGPNDLITRAEMAKWVVLSQMDEATVTQYLAATGGANVNSFADVPSDTSGSDGKRTCGNTDSTKDQPNCKYFPYIEVMSRRGYTKGCGLTNDGRRKYCPDDILTRGQMAVFLIRAKENNVFPTILSGCPVNGGPPCGPGGDNFGLFTIAKPYFDDAKTDDEFFAYIQKMFELGISRGETLPVIDRSTGLPTTVGHYGRDSNLTRGQIAVFVVRAFFL